MAKPRQKKFEGIENEEIKEIRAAAESYVDVRDRRMALTKEEVDHRDKLLEVMEKHGCTEILMDDLSVEIIDGKKKVKVKRSDENGDGDDEDGDSDDDE